MISPADERAFEALAWARDEFDASARPALARQAERLMAWVTTVAKECSACGERLALSAFYPDARQRLGRSSQCRTCADATCMRTRSK